MATEKRKEAEDRLAKWLDDSLPSTRTLAYKLLHEQYGEKMDGISSRLDLRRRIDFREGKE